MQRAIVNLYRRIIRYEGDEEYFKFRFAKDSPEDAWIQIVRFYMPCTDESKLWFSGAVQVVPPAVPLTEEISHDHYFITFGSSQTLDLPELVAASFHYDRFVEHLGLNHTFPLGPNSKFRFRGFSHAMIIAPTFDAALPNFEVLGRHIGLLHVLPITPVEYNMKISHGTDELLKMWERNQKDPSLVDVCVS